MNKPFHLVDDLLFEYDTIDIRTINGDTPEFRRDVFKVRANSNANIDAILSEIQDAEDDIERDTNSDSITGIATVMGTILLTTTIREYPEFVLGLGYWEFRNISNKFPQELRRERYRALAEELTSKESK